MLNVAVTDDEPLLLGLISTVLEKQGHTVTASPGPLECLEVLRPDATSFDLLLTDVEMRPMNGFQMVTELRRSGLTCPVVFMSGYRNDQESISETFGDALVLEKPFTAAELLVAVARARTIMGVSSRAAAAPANC